MENSSAAAVSRGQKRKSKKKYFSSKKHRCGSNGSNGSSGSNRITLGDSLQGFLVTTGGKEFQCLLEAYNVLNEAAERLYGPFGAGDEAGREAGGEEDIEACIKREAEQLKSGQHRRFVQVKTHCHNLLFVRSNDPKVIPEAVVADVFREIQHSKRQHARYIERFLPVVATFKAAQLDKMFEGIEQRFAELAPKEVRSYAVQCRIRNNSSFTGEETLKKRVIAVVQERRPNWYADLANPNVLVVVNVVHKAACLSLLVDFAKRVKYNLIQFGLKCAMANEDAGGAMNSNVTMDSRECDSNSKDDANAHDDEALKEAGACDSKECDSNSKDDDDEALKEAGACDSKEFDSNSKDNDDEVLKEAGACDSKECDSNSKDNDNAHDDEALKEAGACDSKEFDSNSKDNDDEALKEAGACVSKECDSNSKDNDDEVLKEAGACDSKECDSNSKDDAGWKECDSNSKDDANDDDEALKEAGACDSKECDSNAKDDDDDEALQEGACDSKQCDSNSKDACDSSSTKEDV